MEHQSHFEDKKIVLSAFHIFLNGIETKLDHHLYLIMQTENDEVPAF